MSPATVSGAVGPRLHLRLITPDDAEFVFGLRTDPELSRHLSQVTGDAEGQRKWIQDYKAQEAAGEAYYYIICRNGGDAPCGTLRLYDIDATSLTWGSFILGPGKPAKAALESAVLSFAIVFDVLDKDRARIDVERANTRAIGFYRRFGMQQTGESETELFFEYTRDRFEADRHDLAKALREENTQ